jgi:hypothetical protein
VLALVLGSCMLRTGKFIVQATKGARWMPWRKELMKDAVSGETLRGAAIEL